MHPAKNDKKKLQMVAKKKQQNKDDSNSNEAETSNGPRATRSNPVEEAANASLNVSTKKLNKRKTLEADTTPEPKKVEKPAEKVPSDSQNKEMTKTGSSKKEEEKRQTRLSAIRNPSSSTQNFRNGNNSIEIDKYFSSSDDDDEPLVKPEPKSKKAKLNDETTKSKNDSIDIKNNSEASKSQNDSQQPAKSNRGRKKKVVPPPEPERKTPVEPEKSNEKKKVGRKKKTNVDLEIANSQANTTDLSENETRGRPMRKTKEAATIYMELIGRKLTLHDSSDNDSSLDSLEVPNLKRVELMENEMRANCDKAKEAVAEKKKQEEKEVSGQSGG